MWKPYEQNLVSYTGKLPSRLYRYRTVSPDNIERLINSEIIGEEIYLAGLNQLNDPEEGRFSICFKGSEHEIYSYWQSVLKSVVPTLSSKEIDLLARNHTNEVATAKGILPEKIIRDLRFRLENLVRIASFTTKPVNNSMWSNYAKYTDSRGTSLDHAGICIEYLCDESWGNSPGVAPIKYSDKIPEINIIDDNEEDMVKAMLVKSMAWQGEDEWRIIGMLQANPPFPDNLTKNSKLKFENSIQSIIFGLNSPNDLINHIHSKVRESRLEISYQQVVRNLRTNQCELTILK